MDRHFSYRDDKLYYHYSLDEHPDSDSFRMHTHDFCEIYIFLNGTGVFKVEGSEYPLSRGDFLILRPSESHYIDICPDRPYERIAIHFDEKMLDSLGIGADLLSPFYERNLGKQNYYPHSCISSELSRAVISSLCEDSADYRPKIVSHLLLILWEIQRVFLAGNVSADVETLGYRIAEYINGKISESLSLDGISEYFFISKSQLCRVFKDATGSSIKSYIIVKRLANARRLIADGVSPTEAAARSGYEDYPNFYRAYKHHYGVTPKEDAQHRSRQSVGKKRQTAGK